MADVFTNFLNKQQKQLDADGNRIFTFSFPSNSLIGPRNATSQEDYLKQNLESIYDPNYDVRNKGLQPQMAFDAKGNLVQVGNYPDPQGYNFMSSPLGVATRGLVGDVERIGKYSVEGGKTLFNKGLNFIADKVAVPVSNFLADEQGRTPQLGSGYKIGTEKEIRDAMEKRDTTFDKPSLSTNAEETSLLGGWAKSTVNFLAPYMQKLVDLPPLDPEVIRGKKTIIDKFDKDIDAGKLTDASQSDVTSVITKASEITNSTGDITAASSLLTEAVSTDKKSEGFLDKLNTGIDTFLNDLDKPGFQVALAMHMEAKNGGDITSVLFEGMKVKKKAKKDALAAHANNLAVSKAELEIVSLFNKLDAPDKPSKEFMGYATSMFDSNPYDFGNQSQQAAYFMTSLAMGIKKDNPRLTDIEALQQAIAIVPEGTLKKDTFLNFFGGSFNPEKMFETSLSTAQSAVTTNLPNSKADMLKQLMAANTGVSEAEILQYINTTYPSLQ